MNSLQLAETEYELDQAAENLESAPFGEAETTAAKRWHYLDAWLYTTSSGWRFLEKVGPVLETKAGGERLRSTLWFKWQSTATSQGGTLLVRCWSHTGSQWVDCKDHFF